MNTTKIELARQNGIVVPELAWDVARNMAGIPFWVMCAFLEQESGGGRNVYGGDVFADGSPKPFYKHGAVTKENYEAYKKERNLGILYASRWPQMGYRSQGVGPMQLTFWAFQDEADDLGGCWDAKVNMFVGARILNGYYQDAVIRKIVGEIPRWQYAALRYNGKQEYVDSITPKFIRWKDLMV
jgi:hypothetical protein